MGRRSGPMAHHENWLQTHTRSDRYPYIRDPNTVEMATYHWLHALRQDLEDRDEPGDRIVADFIHRIQNGSYGFLPPALDPQEADDVSSCLYAGSVEMQIEDENYLPLRLRLLGRKYDPE